jgi:hypothetical protein
MRPMHDRATSLPSFPASFLVRPPKGLLQCVINFTFPVCRRGERRLRPSSGPGRPGGHQLKALIGQQYIKVAPGSGSSKRQESVSWAFVSNTEIQGGGVVMKERKKKKTHFYEGRTGVSCVRYCVNASTSVHWEPLYSPFFLAPRI